MRRIHLHGTRNPRDLTRVVLAALLTGAMTGGIGYAVASTATADGTTGDLTVQPSISKYVNKIDGGDGDQYELHLTASGDTASSSTTTATPADIVIVADKSGSMNGDRDKNSQNAVDALAQKLLTPQNEGLPENQQIRMAVVTFSTQSTVRQGFTNNANEITSAMKQTPDGGTNWEAALAMANGLSDRQGVKKYIIFLSDGNPTFRTTSLGACYSYNRYSGRYRYQPNYGSQASCEEQNYSWIANPDDSRGIPSGVHGNGRGDEYGFNYKAALAEANKRGNAALYVVKTSSDANKMSAFAKDAHAENNGKEYDGTNAQDLADAFDAIYKSITSTATVNVFSISDTLSQWVDPVDFAGVHSGSDITQYVTARNGDAKLTGYQAVYNVDSSGSRTVTVTFNGKDGIAAGKSDHIDISFRIKPSNAAYTDYATKRTYPNTGEADTGKASANQPGYFANEDAQMSYCTLLNVDGTTTCGPTQTIKYPYPVVQVRLGSIVITKHWSDGADKHAKDSVTVQLQRTAEGSTSAEPVGDPITLNHDNNWRTRVDGLLPGYTYTVVETSNDDRYAITYQYGGDSSANGAELTKKMVWGDGDAGTLSATITNTLETASLSKGAIKVKKVIDGRDWRDSDEFKFTLTPKDPNTPTPMPAGCASKEPCTVTVDSNSPDHTKAFGNITYEAGDHDYHYYVTEQSGTAPAMHYSQARYDIVVSVKTQDGTWVANVSEITKVSDDNGGTDTEDIAPGQPVTFTNKYTAVASLPLTGGATARTWLLTSGSLGVLALLLLVGLAVQKREASLI